MSDLPELPAGVWKHYKSGLYLVFGYGHDSNYEGRVVVVYIGLQLDDAKTGPRLAVRTVEDFFSWVVPTTGEVVQPYDPDGLFADYAVERFRYLGPSWDGS